MANIAPLVEEAESKPFDEIEVERKPALGLVVGGFSSGAYLSEVWEILIPVHAESGTATCRREQGNFGGNWFAMFDPIRRYVKGWDPQLLDELAGYFINRAGGTLLTDAEQNEVSAILAKYEYPIPFGAMPMDEGVAHVRFLVEMVINHHGFAIGAPLVGGRMMIGKVTYAAERFEILEG